MRPDLAVVSATGRTASTPTIDARPRLSEAQAVELAAAHVLPQIEQWRADAALPRKVGLGVYVPQLFGDSGPSRLAYRVLRSGFEVYVDAGSGEILKSFNAVPTARDRRTYDDTGSTTTPALVESDPPFPGQDFDVADGVYVLNERGSLVFRALPSPSKAEVQAVAWSTCERVCKLLRKRGLWLDGDPSEDPPATARARARRVLIGVFAGRVVAGGESWAAGVAHVRTGRAKRRAGGASGAGRSAGLRVLRARRATRQRA